eukprot:358392-Chlamydomonas_euryale.AAC.5
MRNAKSLRTAQPSWHQPRLLCKVEAELHLLGIATASATYVNLWPAAVLRPLTCLPRGRPCTATSATHTLAAPQAQLVDLTRMRCMHEGKCRSEQQA